MVMPPKQVFAWLGGVVDAQGHCVFARIVRGFAQAVNVRRDTMAFLLKPYFTWAECVKTLKVDFSAFFHLAPMWRRFQK